jgi:hypothetical protein
MFTPNNKYHVRQNRKIGDLGADKFPLADSKLDER